MHLSYRKELVKFIGLLSSAAQTVLPVRFAVEIQALHKNCLYQKIIELAWKWKQELLR